MEYSKNGTAIRIITATTFLAMISVNALANILPLNQVNTGQVSDSYPNLFAPAGLTFSIWGLIYFLLAGHTLFQLGLFQSKKSTFSAKGLSQIGLVFSISSLANAAWIFSWHYRMIGLSMILMAAILICLIYIMQQISCQKLLSQETLLVRLPFSIYFGWITVATIANATALLVSLDWNGFGIPESAWAIVIIIAGLLIGSATIVKNRDIAYGLVLVWAYSGILIKHLSAAGFNGQYPGIIATIIASLVLLLLAISTVFIVKKAPNPTK